jgi:transcriptional regulator with XRE-family HTH domain
MSNTAKNQFGFIDDILEETSNIEMKQIEQRMLNAQKIRYAMDKKGWNNTQLLEAMGMKSPSIITKWLSGTHNFTQDKLIEIGAYLEIDFFNDRQPNTKINCYFAHLQNETQGFGSYDSLRYILNANQIKPQISSSTTTFEYQA